MRYRSAAFARLSAHALAGDGSTHFPARGVDADALSPRLEKATSKHQPMTQLRAPTTTTTRC